MNARRTSTWLVAVLVAACAGGHQTLRTVRDAIDEFHNGFRWGAMGSMLPHVCPEHRDTFSADYEERMKGVSIGDYEVRRIQIAEDSDRARVWVHLSWYRQDEMIVQEAEVVEEWIRVGGRWCRDAVVVERGEVP